MPDTAPIVDYGLDNAALSHTHAYLYSTMKASLKDDAEGRSLFALGCGTASTVANITPFDGG